jgi:TolB-like protein/Tfp pilus assembly protein PilF
LDTWWDSRRSALENNPPAPAGDEASIAVLPFLDLTKEKDQGYLCEGLAEEIITTLSRVKSLHVASRSSSFRFPAGGGDARETSRTLRVKSLLEGSVRRSGDRLRIAIQMVDGETGFQGWSATYNREMTEIFALQEEIATSVVQALEVTLSPAEKAAIARPAARDPRAYDCYLRGRKYYYGYGPRDMEFAIQLFIKAITLDLDYALAYAGLADCWSFLYLYSDRSSVIREQAEWASSKAVALDSQCAQSHASRALALSLKNLDAEAETEFEKAKALDPGLFEAHYFHARHSFVRGQYQQAAARYEDAMRVRPEDYQSPLLVAQIYEELGRPEQARQARLRGIDRAKEHLEMNPDDARAVYMAANGMVALGQSELGVEWARRAQQMSPDDSMLLYNVGCIYALAGGGDEAMECLESACEKGLTQKGWYEHDSNLDSLRGQPRFEALLRRLDALSAA